MKNLYKNLNYIKQYYGKTEKKIQKVARTKNDK